MRRASSLWVLALAACGAEVVRLEVQLEAAGTIGLVIDAPGPPRLETYAFGEPIPALELEGEDAKLSLLAWRETEAELGPLRLKPPDGDPAPAPIAAYEADLSRELWRALPSADALATRVVREAPDPCSELEITNQEIPISDDTFGVRGLVPLDARRVLVVFAGAMFVATSTSITRVEAPTSDIRAATRAEDGDIWLTTVRALWRGRWSNGALDLELVLEHPEAMEPTPTRAPYALAAHEGEALELSREGKLRRFVAGGWSLVHTFETRGELHARGSVVHLGAGAFAAGVATDRRFVQVEGGVARGVDLDDVAEGALGFARHGTLGLVAGTGLGHLVVESDDFRALPDPRGALPSGLNLRVLAPLDDALVIGGDVGFIGLLTPELVLCRALEHGAATLRLWAPLDDGVLLAGQTLPTSPTEVFVTHVKRR